MLVLAGAGSGKTRVLTSGSPTCSARASPARGDPRDHVHQQGRPEMRERVEMWSAGATNAMWVMTFHSACARMLRADADRLGYTRQFTIYDSADRRRILKKCLEDLAVDTKRFTPRAMQSQISDAKNRLRTAG